MVREPLLLEFVEALGAAGAQISRSVLFLGLEHGVEVLIIWLARLSQLVLSVAWQSALLEHVDHEVEEGVQVVAAAGGLEVRTWSTSGVKHVKINHNEYLHRQ